MRRARRVRSVIRGTAERPRLSVFRSNRYIIAQLINDEVGKTISTVSSKVLQKEKMNKTESAVRVGEAIAVAAKKAKVARVVFDRGEYRYHGRVRALVEAARKGGLQI